MIVALDLLGNALWWMAGRRRYRGTTAGARMLRAARELNRYDR